MPALPVTVIRPRVIARPIHFTRDGIALNRDLVARRRRPRRRSRPPAAAAFPGTPAARGWRRSTTSAVTSGESTSASSGTEGCSLSVSVIMRASGGRFTCSGSPEPLELDGIVVERHRVGLLEERPDEVLDRRVVRGADDELPALRSTADHIPFLDDDLAALDHVPGIREEKSVLVRLLGIDRHVGIGADAEVPLVRQSQGTRRARRRDDGDFEQRVLPVEIRRARSAAAPPREAAAPAPSGIPRPSGAGRSPGTARSSRRWDGRWSGTPATDRR